MLLFSQTILPEGKGSIKGSIVDAGTKLPLVGVNVAVLNSKLGTTTDNKGHFIISGLTNGSYTLRLSSIGYETKTVTDIIVTPDKTTFVETALKPAAAYEMKAVEVNTGYFSESRTQPVSATNFSYEEIRRAPGAAGDVSRILMSLPSIAKVNDQSNSLYVRGGNPSENAFFIDNIEVPNINHFPMQGSTGGPIG